MTPEHTHAIMSKTTWLIATLMTLPLLFGCHPTRSASSEPVFIPPQQPTLQSTRTTAIHLIPTATSPPTLATISTKTSTPLPQQPTPIKTQPISPARLFPDSEIVFSATAIDFNTQAFLSQHEGILSTYRQYLMLTGWSSGAEIIDLVSIENSINPRTLIALLELESGCVNGFPQGVDTLKYAAGAANYYRDDLYGQLVWVAHTLSTGFYGWLDGSLTQLSYPDGRIFRLAPDTNAGTFALMYLFSQLHPQGSANQAEMMNDFIQLYETMFGNPWQYAKDVEPLLPQDLSQPVLSLPFEPETLWAYSGGPHPAFEGNGPWAALDFAPATETTGCADSQAWVVAMADGLVVRSAYGAVVQDLDGDGYEQTGWAILYLHIGTQDRVTAGVYLHQGDKIGHPSCEGGHATGTHIHIARKYNGVWIPADGAIPFNLDGWIAHAGTAPYKGSLTRDDEVVKANQFADHVSHITRNNKNNTNQNDEP